MIHRCRRFLFVINVAQSFYFIYLLYNKVILYIIYRYVFVDHKYILKLCIYTIIILHDFCMMDQFLRFVCLFVDIIVRLNGYDTRL